MSVTLTDEQYGTMCRALLSVANGYWWNEDGRSTRLSRIACVSMCRQAALDLGYNWKDYHPQRGGD